jgi:hypothetical protein
LAVTARPPGLLRGLYDGPLQARRHGFLARALGTGRPLSVASDAHSCGPRASLSCAPLVRARPRDALQGPRSLARGLFARERPLGGPFQEPFGRPLARLLARAAGNPPWCARVLARPLAAAFPRRGRAGGFSSSEEPGGGSRDTPRARLLEKDPHTAPRPAPTPCTGPCTSPCAVPGAVPRTPPRKASFTGTCAASLKVSCDVRARTMSLARPLEKGPISCAGPLDGPCFSEIPRRPEEAFLGTRVLARRLLRAADLRQTGTAVMLAS